MRLSQAIFQPSRGSVLAALALAAVGFVLPQEVPLEWYPLNHPGPDTHYLEVVCASDKSGTVQVFYDATKGFNPLESIRWPVTPTTLTYTYLFPLPDAPITALRVDPVADGATLTFHRMRIINGRGDEMRRFTRDMFTPLTGIASVSPTPDGWTLTSAAGSQQASARLALAVALMPVGMNARNLQRCLLSTGYLALMLGIILLAVLFVFHRPKNWGEGVSRLGFMAGLALLFALVGNRGLIRNSIHYARFHASPLALGAVTTAPAVGDRTMVPRGSSIG